MDPREQILNKLLVNLFNDLLRIEETSLKNSNSLSDLSITEMHTIEAIGIDKERTMSEVAVDLGITVGTLTTAINKLVKKEYVERRRIEEDRRVVMVGLAQKGRVAYKVHERFHNEMIKDIIHLLNEEEEQIFLNSVQKLCEFFHSKREVRESK